MSPQRDDWLPFGTDSLARGLATAIDPSEILDGETPNCRNVDFDSESVRVHGGSVKFNNQTAPGSAVRTGVDSALSPLAWATSKSVPLRGYAMYPYREEYDVGGDFGASGVIPSQEFHGRRGRSFALSIGFELPASERLYGVRPGAQSGATLLPADANVIQFQALGGYDEAFDECTVIAQKGGDKLAPMSWALGLVNVGDKFEYLTGAATADRPSNIALVFMWFDAPEWAATTPANMRYKVGTGAQPDVGLNGTMCTLAYRAVIAKAWVEPGRRYVATVDLSLDTGTPGGNLFNPSAFWNADGALKIVLHDITANATTICATPSTDLFVWKGPTDSIDYLTRYGVRYSGRDAMFTGLGYRFAPWKDNGFIPFGLDGVPLERGGFSMLPVSDTTAPTGHTLTCDHTSGQSYVVVNHRALVNGNTNGAQVPHGLNGSIWTGLGDGAGVINNGDALRNYMLTIWNQATSQINGVRLKIGTYSEPGGAFRLDCDLTTSTLGWASKACSVQAFRWHQRPLVVQDLRIYPSTLDYTSARTIFSLRANYELDDDTFPAPRPIACWPMDDAGGGVLREVVAKRDGYLAPFMLGQSSTGERGEKRLFLSGEGEALAFDFRKDAVLQRELQNVLRSGSGGFAVEITLELPEAIYAVDDIVGSLVGAKGAPALLTWEIHNPDSDGMTQQPYPLFELTQRCIYSLFTTALRRPIGFMARVATNNDQEAGVWNTIVTGWDSGSGWYWSPDAEWVGKRITFQVGLQSTGNVDEYRAYLAFGPKSAFNPTITSGEPQDVEGVWFTNPITVRRKDLVRSVVTIGGRWDPKNAGERDLGYSELNCRMILDEVRIFGTSAPGTLPLTSGAANLTRDGKLAGERAYPPRQLELADMLRPLGPNMDTANVSEGSFTVNPAGQGRFFTAEARDTIDAVKHTFLVVPGETLQVRDRDEGVAIQDQLYFVSAVAAGGTSATLAGAFLGATRSGAGARSLRLIGYTSLEDDVSELGLTLGRGASFKPGTTTAADMTLTAEYFENKAPTRGQFKLRVFSPIGQSSPLAVLPAWVRGVKISRRRAIRGLYRRGERLYALSRGALYEADDRWRESGPNDAIRSSLAFRASRDKPSGAWLPKAQDCVRFPSVTNVTISQAAIGSNCWVIDAHVWMESTEGLQTIAWVGSLLTNPLLIAGATGHRIHWWLRVQGGRPQLAVGSTAAYAGTSRPEKGLFIATASTSVRPREWTHIRFYVGEQNAGLVLEVPKAKINGRSCGVSVNAWQTAYAGSSLNWMDMSTLVAPGAGAAILVGCARDAFLLAPRDVPYVEGQLTGEHLRPNYLVGRAHSFNGRIAGVVISAETGAFGDTAADFDPDTITYASKRFEALNPAAYSFGHKLRDEPGAQNGVIESHPLVSLFHELGMSDKSASWASLGDRVFVTNGGRPVYAQGESAGFLGVLAPTVPPRLSFERQPLWKENRHTVSNPDNDPIDDAAVGATPIYHFNSLGNNYWRQAYSNSMRWQKDTYYCIKMLFRPRTVSGRIRLWGAVDTLASGGCFGEIRDGRLVVGWWDTVTKKECTIETSAPVFRPGRIYYVYCRKLHPNSAPAGAPAGSTGWRDSIFEQTAGFALDSIIVREFQRENADARFSNYPTFWAKGDGATKNCTSFTTDLEYTITGATATGLVSSSTRTYNGAVTGRVTATAGAPFNKDMVGMYWQWQSGASGTTFDGIVYRIISVDAGGGFLDAVEVQTGAAPDFSTIAAKNGGVFTGIRLIKSADVSSSKAPDDAAYDLELFGTHLAEDPDVGVQNFDGEWWSVAWYVTPADDAVDVNIFEAHVADEIRTGTDLFEAQTYSGPGGPNELKAVGGFVFGCVNTRPATGATTPASSQPNEELRVDMDTEASALADAVFWQMVEDVGSLEGVSEVRVAFYDPVQDQLSNPSPALVIDPGGEDLNNPSAQARLVFRELPISRESPNIQRRVYMSLQNSAALFEVADVPDNSSDAVSVYKSQGEVAQGDALSFRNPAPPKCSLITISNNSLVFANIADDPSGYFFSEPFQPSSAPYGNYDLFATGSGREITAIADLKGYLLLFKADAMKRAVLRDGIVIPEDVSGGQGCVASGSLVVLDNRAYFQSARGLYVYYGQGLPVWLCARVSDLFEGELDRRAVANVVGGISRRRNQYVVTAQDAVLAMPSDRISTEIDDEYSGAAVGNRQLARHRFSRYRWPLVTALAAYTLTDESDRLVAGTEDGYVVWLDRTETKRIMLGPDSTLWGPPSVTAGAGSSADRVSLSGAPAVDSDLEGCRGAPLEWVSGGVRRAAVVLVADVTAMWVDRRTSATLPVNGDALTVGAQDVFWESKWFDLGAAFIDKRARWLDLTFERGSATGTMRVELFTDHDDATVMQTEDVAFGSQLTPVRLDLNEHISRWFKIRISVPHPVVDTFFSLSKLFIRAASTDQA